MLHINKHACVVLGYLIQENGLMTFCEDDGAMVCDWQDGVFQDRPNKKALCLYCTSVGSKHSTPKV